MKSSLAAGQRPPGVFYHYTTISGLIGILGTQTLWATDYRFLNDSTEITYARGLFETSLARRLQRSTNPAVRDGLTRLRNAMDMVAAPSLYLICFCKERDLLSQWRGYATEEGYSLGFSTREWAKPNGSGAQYPIHIAQVVYQPARQIKEIEAFLVRLMRALRRTTVGAPKATGVSRVGSVLLGHLPELVRLLIRFKDQAFAAENEWRVVVQAGEATATARCYRPTNLGPVPYIPLALSNRTGKYADRLPIVSVTYGPTQHSETTRVGLEGLLEKYGYDDVKVLPSRIPYRSR